MAQTTMAGYHGTIDIHARNILQTQRFYISKKPFEWLGFGSYFFKYSRHAENWAALEAKKPHNHGTKPVVLEVSLECDDSQILDLNNPDDYDELNDFIEDYFATVGAERYVDYKNMDEHKKWCFSCNLYRKANPEIAITMYTFPRKTTDIFSVYHPNQTQICVSQNKQNTIKTIKEWKAEV